MISHIEGRVAEKRAGELVIDVNGVGFLLLCAGPLGEKLERVRVKYGI